MTPEEALQDVIKREEQLRMHIIRSEEYLRRLDRDLKRQVLMLYVSIVLLLGFQGLYAWSLRHELAFTEAGMMVVTSLLAIFNCVLLIRTKGFMRRINEAWINPAEKIALDSVRMQRREILERMARAGSA